jgi:RHS repeat-associated protein
MATSPGNDYIYAGSLRVASIQSGTADYWHNDHLSPRVRTDTSGNVADQRGTFPFGETWYSPGSSPYIFTTYYRDYEAEGNDYAQARSYVGGLGRFSSPDRITGSTSDPQSLNSYSYVRNMPHMLTDPLGLFPGGCIPMARHSNPDQGGSSASESKGQGPSAPDGDAPFWVPDPQAEGDCASTGGGGGGFSLDGGYNGDDSGFGVGFPAGVSGGIGGAIFVLTTSEVPNPDWFKNNCMEWDSDCGNMPLWVESQQIQILADPFGLGAGGGGAVAKPRSGGFNPNKVNSCFAKGLKETGLSIGLDVVGAIPGLGNMVSASAGTARAVNDIVTYGGGVAGIATSVSDESPFGTLSSSGGLGLALADMSVGGTKAIPIVGNVLSGATGVYDIYHFNKVVQACIVAP